MWGWRATLVGVTYAATMVLFVLANRQTTSANAVCIQSTSLVYLIFLIEPAFNPGFAWLVHREVPGTWPLVGALVTLGTSLLRAVAESRRRRALDPPSGRF